MVPKIPMRAVRRFLARPRKDYRKWQTKSLAWLQSRMERLEERPPIWKRLKKHQRVCFLIGAELQRFCFWNDTGTGKTLLSLALALFFRKIGVSRSNLVLVPAKINKYEWANDVRKHSPNTEVLILEGSTEAKWAALNKTKAPLIVETYGGLLYLVSEKKEITRKGKKLTKFKVTDRRMKALLKIINGLYMDESIYVMRKQGHGSLIHRICRRISKNVECVFALNGTPFGKDPTDMWGQVHLVDFGYTLGETLALFRKVFFHATENFFGGANYKFDKTKEALLHDIQANISIRYTAEASDLPRVVPLEKVVSLGADADAYYQRAKEAIIAARGNYKEMENVFLRMRQISSGFVGYRDDELGTKTKYVFDECPKLDACVSFINSIQREWKSVVFHEFTFSGDMLAKRLKEEGVNFARIYGKSKDADRELDRFSKDPKCRVLLLQNQSGGYGLDRVKVAKYGLYYESPVSTVLRKQTRRRVERQYSEHESVFIVDFITKGTADETILKAHAEGFDLFRGIVEGITRAERRREGRAAQARIRRAA